jgi:hypothetical protein
VDCNNVACFVAALCHPADDFIHVLYVDIIGSIYRWYQRSYILSIAQLYTAETPYSCRCASAAVAELRNRGRCELHAGKAKLWVLGFRKHGRIGHAKPCRCRSFCQLLQGSLG